MVGWVREATGDGSTAPNHHRREEARDGQAGDGGGGTGKATRRNPTTTPYRAAARRTRSQHDTHRSLTGHDRAGGCGRGSGADGAAAGPPQAHGKARHNDGETGNPSTPPGGVGGP